MVLSTGLLHVMCPYSCPIKKNVEYEKVQSKMSHFIIPRLTKWRHAPPRQYTKTWPMLRTVYRLGHASDACCTNVHTRNDVSKLRLIVPPNSCPFSSHPAATCRHLINTSIFRYYLFTAPLLPGILCLENDITSRAWIVPGTAANFSFISYQAVISAGPPSTVLHWAFLGRHILGISPGGEEQK